MRLLSRGVPAGFVLLGWIVAISISRPALAADRANRTVPTGRAADVSFNLSANPTDAELFRVRVFQEPLVPIGGQPSATDNAALAAALRGYANRSGPDDFSSLKGFLDEYPNSPWAAAVWTGLGGEYYNTAYYSLALEAWKKGWIMGQAANTANGLAVSQRALAELAWMYARLGRMSELDALITSVKGRRLMGPAAEKISEVREGLWTMKHRPEIAFRCGPLALYRIKQSVDPKEPCTDEIFKSASTTNGTCLGQLVTLSRKIGLNYQMAYRDEGSALIVPSVIHWKVGHYAAIVGQVGDKFLVKDPTFRNDVWATREALDDEASGYFLVPSGALPPGWRSVSATEGGRIWGKGFTVGNDPGPMTWRDPHEGPEPCEGMPSPSVHLETVNLSVVDTPVGYRPPVGPPVPFTVRYNSRDSFQPFTPTFVNFGQLWTCDWISYITDDPSNALADVTCYVGGGGYRTFTGFNTNTQSFGYEQYDQTLLTRTSSNPISYQLLYPDGSREVFGQPDGSIGTSRRVFLTQRIDPQGNAVTLTYGPDLLITAITDAIGQSTTFTYGLPSVTNASGQLILAADPYKLTSATDPFGRTATFNYTVQDVGEQGTNPVQQVYAYVLSGIQDEIGMNSVFDYGMQVTNYADPTEILYDDLMTQLITPYGTTTFTQGSSNTTRWVETGYPDGSRDRVEYNQNVNIPASDPVSTVPLGMSTYNSFLDARDTYFWSRNAGATAYGDYTKARLFHWLHTDDLTSTSGILESTKDPLENRVWRDYAGQGGSYEVGVNNCPTHIGRVLDDGSTQLYTYTYNGFGHVTTIGDPVGRTFSYIYATNGIDLLQIRQTRGHNNDLLFNATYNSQHCPLSEVDAAGQTNTFTYNARGQVLTATDPKGETTTYNYDGNGYLLSIDGPLPGTGDSIGYTYDSFGRVRTLTDVSGYTLTCDYDNLNRITRITYPDSTFDQITYDRLDPIVVQDRVGRQTFYQYDNMRQLVQRTDPLDRVTQFDWCNCGAIKSMTDPMGRTTTWDHDVQGRLTDKIYSDGSKVTYSYENTTSRIRAVTDESLQDTIFTYNLDNTIASCSYDNAIIPTPAVTYTYDPNYERLTSRTDGAGTTSYSYYPITNTPSLGAGELSSVAGPVTNALVSYSYDELGRPVHRFLNGVDWAMTFDVAGREIGASNALGNFTYAYDGNSDRVTTKSFPNGLTAGYSYGNALQDFRIQGIANANGATPISDFAYTYNVPANQIATWSQQIGAQTPSIFAFGYDAVNQLLTVTVTNGGTLVNGYGYSYDFAGNRGSEQIGPAFYASSYNALNQLNISTAPGNSRTNEWDAAHRLVAVNSGNERAEFCYDGDNHVVGIRQLVNGAEVSHRLFFWEGGQIREELDTNGVVTKRFFSQGVQLANGPNAGNYYYTRDHLGSIRELTDSGGNVRAEYAYDPFGRRTKVSGDLDADYGFAGMFWSSEANLSLTHFRAYDPALGRWLSRDPLMNAEMTQGPNLYAYVGNEPNALTDPEGLAPPGWGFNTVSATLLAAAASGQGEELAEDLGLQVPGADEVVQGVQQCAQTLVGYAPGWGPVVSHAQVEVADTLVPSVQQTIQSLAGIEPYYESYGFSYVQEVAWVDENGVEVSEEEADLLYENLEWAEEYWKAAFNNLAQVPPGPQKLDQLGQIFRTLAIVRGSILH